MADGAAPNKKRGALRQLTKDDDPDTEDDSSPSESGTFKRASAEVMATRKIVKVRRSAAASTGSNPFAHIQLVAPGAAPTSTPLPTPTTDGVPKAQAASADLVQEAAAKSEGEENVNGNGKAATENGSKEEQPAAGQASAETAPAEGKALDGPTSFEQVSSSTNAFGTFGTSFSGSAFSFSSSLGSSSAFSFGSSASLGSATSFSFGSSSSGFASFNASTGFETKSAEPFPTIFGSTTSSSSSPSAVQQSHPTVSLQEVSVETGEEKEKAVFAGDAILYEFVDKSWKERGKGELKLNVSEDKKARLVMRSKGNLKLLLNAGLFPDMRVSKMDTRSVTFACANSAATGRETALTTYAVKLRDASGIPDFLALVEGHKGVKSSSVSSAGAGTSSHKPDDEHKKEAETTKEAEVQNDVGDTADTAGKDDQVPVATGGEDDQPKEQALSTETDKEPIV